VALRIKTLDCPTVAAFLARNISVLDRILATKQFVTPRTEARSSFVRLTSPTDGPLRQGINTRCTKYNSEEEKHSSPKSSSVQHKRQIVQRKTNEIHDASLFT